MDIEREQRIDVPGRIFDADLAPDGRWVATVQGLKGDERYVYVSGRRMAAPRAFHFGVAIARRLPQGNTLVIDVRSRPDEDNAWIMSDAGDVLHSFHVGDGVNEVLTSEGYVVVGYFDEGIFGKGNVGREGVVAFSHRGEIELA
jgi:hypothetical protein